MENTPPVQASPVQNTEIVKPVVPEVPVPTPPVPPRPTKKILVISIIVVLLLAFLGGIYYFLIYSKKTTSGVPSSRVGTTLGLPKYFVNCDDSRHVLEEGNLLYVGCLGGVVVFDKTKSEIVDQIGLSDGLGDVVGRSLIKKGDMLYIGTQDGITVFNLKTREARKISVGEGLVSGSNIEIYEDGDDIWVATFDGLSIFDTKGNRLTNYKTELDNLSEKQNIQNILLMEKYVYLLETGSAASNGAVIRYDRSSKTFTQFRPDAFGKTGQYARVDFSRIGNFGSLVFVSEGSDVYVLDENGDNTWKKLDSINEYIKKDNDVTFASVMVLKNTDAKGILLLGENKVYRYIPSTETTEVVYDFKKDYLEVLNRNEGSKIWIKNALNKKEWLSALDLTTLKVTDYTINDRPVAFNQLVGVIDDKPIIETGSGVFRYEPDINKFTRILDTKDAFVEAYGEPVFLPIPGTSEILLVRQVCGQGCGKPIIQTYDYGSEKVTDLEVPKDVMDKFTDVVEANISYPEFVASWRDVTKGEIGFSDYAGKKHIVFNLNTRAWNFLDNIPDTAVVFDRQAGISCNRIYSYATNGNKFNDVLCESKAENEALSWELKEGKVIETNKTTQVTKTLDVPFLKENYTPFETMGEARINGIMFASEKLWIKSDRGLLAYSPASGSFKTYSPSDGLLSKDIIGVMVSKYLWVITGWGGLSILQP